MKDESWNFKFKRCDDQILSSKSLIELLSVLPVAEFGDQLADFSEYGHAVQDAIYTEIGSQCVRCDLNNLIAYRSSCMHFSFIPQGCPDTDCMLMTGVYGHFSHFNIVQYCLKIWQQSLFEQLSIVKLRIGTRMEKDQRINEVRNLFFLERQKNSPDFLRKPSLLNYCSAAAAALLTTNSD